MIRKRIGVMLLSLIVAVSMMPLFAYAEAEQIQPVGVSSESVMMSGSMDDDQLLEEYVRTETEEKVALSAGQDAEGLHSVRGDRLRGNNRKYYDALMEGISRIAAGESDKAVITMDLKKVMGGKLSFTAKDLGVSSVRIDGRISPRALQAFEELFRCDLESVYRAILYDCPYKLFWHDKCIRSGAVVFDIVPGISNDSFGYYVGKDKIYFLESDKPKVQFSMYVSKDYSRSGAAGTLDVDTVRIQRAKAASTAAAELVTACSNETDYGKLVSYRDYICDNNIYNSKAISSHNADTNNIYGDPWQLISVFDGDPETNVVCEGYAKAFQFLCDMTDFSSPVIESHIITGRTDADPSFSGTVSNSDANHMWNSVRMNNGRYYLVDLTNCDSPYFAPDLLFLKGCSSGSVAAGHRYNGKSGRYIYYRYDEDSRDMYSYELNMSPQDYDPAESVNEQSLKNSIVSMIRSRSIDDDDRETDARNARAAAAADAEQVLIDAARKAAEEAGAGKSDNKTDTGTKIRSIQSRKIHRHIFRKQYIGDRVKYSCINCSLSYYASGVTVDLPKVKIRKPSAARGSFTARWKKVTARNRSRIKGIEIQYSTSKKFSKSKTVRTGKTKAGRKISKLARRKTYYVRVRSYKWIKGRKHVSGWSEIRTVRTK